MWRFGPAPPAPPLSFAFPSWAARIQDEVPPAWTLRPALSVSPRASIHKFGPILAFSGRDCVRNGHFSRAKAVGDVVIADSCRRDDATSRSPAQGSDSMQFGPIRPFSRRLFAILSWAADIQDDLPSARKLQFAFSGFSQVLRRASKLHFRARLHTKEPSLLRQFLH